jgi:hypothetical protein
VLPEPFSQRWVVQVHQTFLDQGQQLLDGALSLSQLRLEPTKQLAALVLSILALVEVALEQVSKAIGLEDVVG